MLHKSFIALRCLALVALLSLIPQQAHACSCVEPGPPEEALADADAVFAGKAINYHFPTGDSAEPIVATFRVTSVWKGDVSRLQAVYTVASSCSRFFQMPEEYLVYAYAVEGNLTVSLCGRTELLENATEDLTVLGEGQIPSLSTAYLPTLHGVPCAQNLAKTLEENSGFRTLLQALDAANLTPALESAGPFTLFAPTDAAFDKLPSGALEQLLANPQGQLTQILLYHFVPGRITLDELEHGKAMTTQQGKTLTVDRSTNCRVTVNGGRILTPDIPARNGIVHAIDTVLLPPPD